ncbi:MAG TPA: SIS domain-containing protein [Patescibacteria group bacterium]|nr:SIS domain-containing protein [Patescibacteria group bacterium]
MDINKPDEYKKLDSLGVEKALSLFPEQIKEAWKQASVFDIPSLTPASVLISGMGGSSNAAKILQGVFEEDLKYPLEIRSDYGIPAWVDSETLVVANSYSGNTEETLSAIEAARKAGAKVMGVATGGKIGEMVTSKAIPGAVVSPGATNPTGFPKTGLGVSLGALAAVLSKAGVLPLSESVLFSAVDDMVEIRKSWEAKEVSSWLHGSTPVFFGGKPLVGALNAGRNATCEISRNFTQFYDFPEVNHVLIEALQKPEQVKKNKYLFFESNFNHPRVKERYEITKGILTEMGLEHRTYLLKGSSKLSQSLELAHFCGWLGFYLALLDDTDPGPEPWIIKLKQSLAQPTH